MSAHTASNSRRFSALVLPLIWVTVTVLVIVVSLFGFSPYWMRQVLLVSTMALLISGLNLSIGWAGELNMGLPAMYAAGAYMTAWFSSRIFNDILVCFVLSVVAAVVVGLIAGAPGLRLGGWMLGVATFLLVMLIPVTLQVVPVSILGGQSGFTGIPFPKLFGITLSSEAFFVIAIVVVSLWFAVYRNAVKSPFGDSLRILQYNATLAPSQGLSRYRLKLTTYAFGAIPVGLAGTIFAFTDLFIAPDSLGLGLILNLLVASIVAGQKSVYAIFVGAAFVQFVSTISTRFGEFGEIAFGVFLVIGGVALGGGVAGFVARMTRRFQRRPGRTSKAQPVRDRDERRAVPALEGQDVRVENVSKVFGGAKAVTDVSYVVRAGEITALIGPNGSGKTTNLNMINGFIKPTAGRIVLGSQDIAGMSAMKVARLGVTRTFQTPSVPNELTVLEVVESSRIASEGFSLFSTILRTPGYRRGLSRIRAEAREWLDVLGLGEIAEETAASMSLGTRRMIELARALSARPSVLLLDEVASGLDADEVQELARVLREVRAAGATVVLVEHNFSLVQSLADHIVVLADGSVIADGTAREIATHPEVLERFLGTGAGISGTTIDDHDSSDAPTGVRS